MAEATSWESAIVAVEGPSKTVSTQLRLLPSTPHILILPALDTYMPTTTTSSFLDVYDPVHHLRQVNAAMKRRHRDAQAFLRGSSASEDQDGRQRLVFLEGGTASAQALCLKALMHNETGGDGAAAEAVLARLTRRGLTGLERAGEEQRARSEPIPSYRVTGQLGDEDDDDDDALTDPITRAMRAADALDRQTASLQVSNELDLTMRSLCRSSSLPLYDTASRQDGAGVFEQQTSSFDDDDDDDDGTPTATTEQPAKSPALSRRHRFSVVHYEQSAEMPSVFGFDDFPTGRSSVSSLSTMMTAVDSEATPRRDSTRRHHGRFASSPISPMSDAFSTRSSFGQVEYGRASLLELRSSTSVRGPPAGSSGLLSGGRGGGGRSVQAVVDRGTTGGTTAHNHTTAKPKPKLNHHSAVPKLSCPSSVTVADETRLLGYNTIPARQFSGNSAEVSTTLSSSPPTSTMTTGSNTTTAAAAANMAYPLTRVPSTTSRPRTIVVKRTRPVIKLQPVPSTKRRRWQQGQSTYIDDNAGEESPQSNKDDDAAHNNTDYEPVFPRMEDLVLYLRSDLTPQPLLESALNAMREEYMRNSTSSSSGSSSPSSKDSSSSRSRNSLTHTDDGTAALTSPEESGAEQDTVEADEEEEEDTPKTAVKVTEALPSMDDYDPFAYINPVYGTTSTTKPVQQSVTILHPPTPAQTPPPDKPADADTTETVASQEPEEPQHEESQQQQQDQPQQPQADTEKEVIEELDCTIHQLPISPTQTPIALQNSLRAVLRQHYPLTSTKTPFTPPFSPPADSDEDLWRPLFGRKATSSLPAGVGGAPRGHLRHAHKQVLAVGVQPGVRRASAARVISQVERFGTEPTGSSRCARLDFRYLLANTMQAFAAAARTPPRYVDNGSPELLAALMLPHLETYLAVHADVRFLILEYPAEHLPTVAAMQRLAGADLLKVAQVVVDDDTDHEQRLPFQHVREGSGASAYSQRTTSLSSSSRSMAVVSEVGGTANYLLPASASARDVADFVAAVWDVAVADRPRSAQQDAASVGTVTSPPTPTIEDYESLPLDASHARQPSELAVASPPTPQESPVRRKPKPAQLRVSALSAFPKPTGPQSPLTPSASLVSSVLAPPQQVTPPMSGKPRMDEFRPTTSSSRRSPSLEEDHHPPQPAHVVARVSAVGTSTLHLRRQLSNSTMRTTASAVSRASTTTPHIAHMRKGAAAPSTPSRLYDPPSSSSTPRLSSAYHPQNQQQQQQYHHHLSLLAPPAPRFIDSPSLSSVAGSTLHNGLGIMDDGASSIMTFDPADDSDYDQEERRLMPFFGKKRRRAKPGTQKALRVLGMMA